MDFRSRNEANIHIFFSEKAYQIKGYINVEHIINSDFTLSTLISGARARKYFGKIKGVIYQRAMCYLGYFGSSMRPKNKNKSCFSPITSIGVLEQQP